MLLALVLALSLVCWFPLVSFVSAQSQNAGPSCEEQLAQVQKQLALIKQSRDQTEERAAALWLAAENQVKKAAQAQAAAKAADKKDGGADEKK